MKNSNVKGFATASVVVIVVLLAALGIAGFYVYKVTEKTPAPSTQEPKELSTSETGSSQPKSGTPGTSEEKQPLTPPPTEKKPSLAPAPTPTPTPTPTQTSPITFELKSNFLKNDSTAQKIATAQTLSYQLTNFPSKNSFGFKLISGLVQLGYIYPRFDPSTPHTRMLQNFQRDYNLPTSNTVSQKVMQQLDTLLAEREIAEAQTAKTFPLYGSMALLPAGYPTKDHALYVYATAFKSLPLQLVSWTFDNFKSFYNRHQIADPITYYFGYSDSLSKDDLTLAATLLHEYAHYLEASGQINTVAFYDVGWTLDSNSTRATPKGTVKRSQPINPATYPNQQGFLYHDGSLSQYAGALLSGGAEEGKVNNVAEDFAESFAAYVLEGRVFRGKIANNAILAQKYNWLKNNVFSGKEYQTGNGNYTALDFQPQDSDQGFKSIPAKIEDYSVMDKSLTKWDFQIK